VLVFWDESGASLLPVTRRTWAPRGVTPVIRHHFNWKRASMAVGLCYGSRGGGAALAFHRQPGACHTDSNLKGVELANLAGDTLDDVTVAAQRGVQRVRGTPHLAYSFLRHCGLSLW
jgi:hypothetical protein